MCQSIKMPFERGSCSGFKALVEAENFSEPPETRAIKSADKRLKSLKFQRISPRCAE